MAGLRIHRYILRHRSARRRMGGGFASFCLSLRDSAELGISKMSVAELRSSRATSDIPPPIS